MRKTLGLLCAVAMMLPIGVLTAGPAAAAPIITCLHAKGTFKFTPPLPASGGVKSTLTAQGSVYSCTGKGGSSGKTSFKSNPPTTKSTCSTLAHPNPAGTKGTLTIKWVNGKVSTAKGFVIKQGTGSNISSATTTGKITSGAFVGKLIKGAVTFKLSSPACPTKGGTYTEKKGTKFTVG
jgi:hypothetical protein